MKIQKFEQLVVWQKSQDLAVDIYSTFDELRDFSFRDQIRRASVSISNNIAEGFDRNSAADFNRFLYFAISSCSEVRSMLYLAKRLNYISIESNEKLNEQANEVSKMITGLIKYLKRYYKTTNN